MKAKKAKRKDEYVDGMKAWLAQRRVEIASCLLQAHLHQQMISIHQADVRLRRRGITLERRQAGLARISMRKGERDLARHLRQNKKGRRR